MSSFRIVQYAISAQILTFGQQHLNNNAMKRHFENLAERAARAVKHWWLMMVAGILCIIAGICVFVFPLESYVTLSVLFGVLMLLTGAAQLIIASSSGNYLTMKGYFIVGGVLDVILGIFLCVYPGVSLVALPIMMGLWLMYNSFVIIAFGGDMDTFKLSGGGMLIVLGILLLVLSLFVLLNPLSVGITTVLIVAGAGLILFGLTLFTISLKIRDLDKLVKTVI
jgi:uncharacterized membrane protein HdeD (DUF308 family)